MNEQEKQRNRNNNKREYVASHRSLTGEASHPIVRLHRQNTLEHELGKLKITRDLRNLGHHVLTEATLKTGGRADIFDLDDCEVYEILHTETKEQLLKKLIHYPASLYPIKAFKVKKAVIEMEEVEL